MEHGQPVTFEGYRLELPNEQLWQGQEVIPVDVIVQEHPLRVVKQELQLHGLCAELPLGLLSEAQVAVHFLWL